MLRPARSKLSPWIEALILSHGRQEEGEQGGGRPLKAHVIGVSEMSESQVEDPEGPSELLFLSDGVVHIRTVLTTPAWEHLQEWEERDSFSSLVNTRVCIQDYRLQFHMAPEQADCSFFISVGKMTTLAVSPVKDKMPCCSTLPSVRLKICQMWVSQLDEEDSQKSQGGFDLTELLEVWQQDCLQEVLDDVEGRLRMASIQQPSTSTQISELTRRVTSWDEDRVRYKGLERFSVPIKFLLIPEEDAQQLQTDVGDGSQGDVAEVCRPSERPLPSVDDADWQIAPPAAAERVCDADGSSPVPVEDIVLHEDMMDRSSANPWDEFPPPCVTSTSSDASPETTPTLSQLDPAAILTSTQLPVHSSKESSFLPPYQKQQSSNAAATAGPSASTSEHSTGQPNVPALDREGKDVEETGERKHRKAKRKRRDATPEDLTNSVEEVGGSPPSWLFDTQSGGLSSPNQPAGTIPRKTPRTHSDGRPFSYSYQASGQNLQDFNRLRVAESLLHWAVKYLTAPRQVDDPPDVAGQDLSLPSVAAEPDRDRVQSCNS